MEPKILPESFFIKDNTIKIAKELLGKFLCTNIDGTGLTCGMIVEDECYLGPEDKASHAYNNLRSKRNESLYRQGGIAYVYLCYGIHNLFNVVTNKAGMPHGILIRAIEPVMGIDIMLKRRNKPVVQKNLTSGPGALTKALGIDLRHNGILIAGSYNNYNNKNKDQNRDRDRDRDREKKHQIWVEDRGLTISAQDIIATPRIGVDYAEDHAELHWRFSIRNNKWVSESGNNKNNNKK